MRLSNLHFAVILLAVTPLLAKNEYYRGITEALSEKNTYEYIALRDYVVVLDGKKISSEDLLYLKSVGKRLDIPNIRFINNRFLVFGDYQREADAQNIYRKLMSVLADEVTVRVAKSALFGDTIIDSPIMASAYRDSYDAKRRVDVYSSDVSEYDNRERLYDMNSNRENYIEVNPQRRGRGRIEEKNLTYDNSLWDEAVIDTKQIDAGEEVLESFKKATINQNHILVAGKRAGINKVIEGYKIMDINKQDSSFMIKSMNNGDVFIVEKNNLIKM